MGHREKHLIRWVEKMAELCTPEFIHWVDGSEEENTKLCVQLFKIGTFIKLNESVLHGTDRVADLPDRCTLIHE